MLSDFFAVFPASDTLAATAALRSVEPAAFECCSACGFDCDAHSGLAVGVGLDGAVTVFAAGAGLDGAVAVRAVGAGLDGAVAVRAVGAVLVGVAAVRAAGAGLDGAVAVRDAGAGLDGAVAVRDVGAGLDGAVAVRDVGFCVDLGSFSGIRYLLDLLAQNIFFSRRFCAVNLYYV